MIAAFPAAEIADAMLPGFLVRPAPVLRAKPCAPVHAQGRSVSPDWNVVPNSRALSLGAHGGLVDGQSMASIEMPSEHLAAPAGVEAHDIILVN